MTFVPSTVGLEAGAEYVFSAPQLPAGLSIDPDTGEISGVIETDPGGHDFDIMVSRVADAEVVATGSCSLTVNDNLTVVLQNTSVPCLQVGESLLDFVEVGTGDGSPIVCDLPALDCTPEESGCGLGEGRVPSGVGVDAENCSVAGIVDEVRLGTWIFTMRAVQSGAELFVPVCVTNDEVQGYDVSATHGGVSDSELLPIVQYYDSAAPFSVGGVDDPRFEVTNPTICDAGSCFYSYNFIRSGDPVDDLSFSLEPSGFVQDGMMQNVGFFHGLQFSGPAVPQDFQERPWVLSVAAEYCISAEENGCDDISNGDAAFEFGVIMWPESEIE